MSALPSDHSGESPAPEALQNPALPAVALPPAEPAVPKQRHNPLHGITLEAMVVALSEHYGWDDLGRRIAIRCFQSDPSVASSLKFLRKTPWAREKVESLYLFMLRDQARGGRPAAPARWPPTADRRPPPARRGPGERR